MAENTESQVDENQVDNADRKPANDGVPTGTSYDQVDLEDGELSDEGNDDTQENSTTVDAQNNGSQVQPSASITDSAQDGSLKDGASASDLNNDKSAGKKRKISASSDDNELKSVPTDPSGQPAGKDDESSESSTSSEEEKSERKRKKKEEKRRKKEKKREKRKREKQKEREERKKRRRHHHDDYDRGGPYNDMYDDYYEEQHRNSYNDARGHYNYNRSPPAPGPYDSPPADESSDDEFYEALCNMVDAEPMDPNVSVAERESILRKHQKRLPGLSPAKIQKILKKRKWKEQRYPQQTSWRNTSKRPRDEEPKQKCKFYAEGKCQKGDKCQYSHNFIPAKKMEACKFFLQGYCAKGDMCIYLHSEVPCKYYHTGQKCFNAEKCKFSHDPLTDSTKPLLEKAILLEETGTFKPEKPSLLGSPPKETFAPRFESNFSTPTVTENKNEENDDNIVSKLIPSIFDLELKPSADLQEKLDAGLYEEITAPLSDEDDEKGFGSPTTTRPQAFYSDTLSSGSPNKPTGQVYSSAEATDKSSSAPIRRKRWGPDLPTVKTDELGSGDSMRVEAVKKTPLLPLPTPPTPFSQPSLPNSAQQSSTTDTLNTQTAQQAAANLTRILNVLRSGTASTNSNSLSRAADPRVSQSADPRVSQSADPRVSQSTDPRVSQSTDPRVNKAPTVDPRSQDASQATAFTDPRLSDPRSVTKTPLLPDPRSSYNEPAAVAYDPRMDPRKTSISSPQHLVEPTLPMLVTRPAPELNGKPAKPMDYRLKPLTLENKGIYIPPGADSSQEMLKDPRIRKRIQSLKQDELSAPPSLPDITADLHRMQSAMVMSNAGKIEHSRLSGRPSSDSDPEQRRSSTENKLQTNIGQGDQNSSSNETTSDTIKPRNPARTTLSRVQASLSVQNSYSGFSNSRDDDEDEDNSLTIDMTDDDSKKTNVNGMETACS